MQDPNATSQDGKVDGTTPPTESTTILRVVAILRFILPRGKSVTLYAIPGDEKTVILTKDPPEA